MLVRMKSASASLHVGAARGGLAKTHHGRSLAPSRAASGRNMAGQPTAARWDGATARPPLPPSKLSRGGVCRMIGCIPSGKRPGRRDGRRCGRVPARFSSRSFERGLRRNVRRSRRAGRRGREGVDRAKWQPSRVWPVAERGMGQAPMHPPIPLSTVDSPHPSAVHRTGGGRGKQGHHGRGNGNGWWSGGVGEEGGKRWTTR